jgi:hypothetical protein
LPEQLLNSANDVAANRSVNTIDLVFIFIAVLFLIFHVILSPYYKYKDDYDNCVYCPRKPFNPETWFFF